MILPLNLLRIDSINQVCKTLVGGSFYFLELKLKSVKGSNLTFTNIVRIRGKIVQCVIRTAILSTESRSAKRRRLREELKATKRAYRSQPSTPKNIVSNNFLRVLKSFISFTAFHSSYCFNRFMFVF